MILADSKLRDLIEEKQVIKGYGDFEEQLQPASFDLRLDPIIALPCLNTHDRVVDPENVPDDLFERVDLEDKPHTLYSGAMVLGSTMESVEIPRQYVAMVNGRSTLGRLGLAIHITAGFIDPGFKGNITLEILNTGPFAIQITPGMRIAQLVVVVMRGTVERPYGAKGSNNKYQNQVGVTAPRKEIK